MVRQGNEQQPVVVIDDFAPDPEILIERAARLPYGPMGRAFPGVRAKTEVEVLAPMFRRIEPVIGEVFGVTEGMERIASYYSLVTTPPSQLQLLQRLPHFDGVGAVCLAMVHHLSRAETGGTAFYRHRSTGFETITAERLPRYNQAVSLELARLGQPPAQYVSGDTALYEQIALHEARFNRLILYRGTTLHSAQIPADAALSADPRCGRFSINTFIEGGPAATAGA